MDAVRQAPEFGTSDAKLYSLSVLPDRGSCEP